MLTETAIAGIPVVVDRDAAADGVLVAFTGRAGGVSRAPYESLNLAARVGDDPAMVEENRRLVAAALGFAPERLVFARQVHGADVLEARPGDAGIVGACDVLVARTSGPVLAILTADCVPVVLRGDSAIAVVHAGWRGLVAGAIAAATEQLGTVHKAWVGPAIHACCYQVGPEVIAAFRDARLPVAAPDRVDPGRAAVVALRHARIDEIEVVDACTSCDPGYFSYRRDGATGRQAAFAAMLGPGA